MLYPSDIEAVCLGVPAALAECAHTGGVTMPPPLVFYQARAACAGGSEAGLRAR